MKKILISIFVVFAVLFIVLSILFSLVVAPIREFLRFDPGQQVEVLKNQTINYFIGILWQFVGIGLLIMVGIMILIGIGYFVRRKFR